MKIKRFVAPDMRTAFRMVREEHGPDAVILSNRRTAEGIEIVAASNYDEELVQRALETARSRRRRLPPRRSRRHLPSRPRPRKPPPRRSTHRSRRPPMPVRASASVLPAPPKT